MQVLDQMSVPDAVKDISADLKELEGQYAMFEAEKFDDKVKELKHLLSPKIIKLKTLKVEIDELEINLKKCKATYNEVLDEVRFTWQPFIEGADKAEITVNGIAVKIEAKLNVTVEDEENVTGWLLTHGYEKCMKYQIHNQTLKKIARDLKEDEVNPVEIPGLKYSKFNVVTVK